MAKGIFNEKMSLDELRRTLFHIVEGKSKEEVKAIQNEAKKFIPKIIEREMSLAKEGWML